MRFYTRQHKHYCGIDLHARTMYLCIMNQAGDVLLHQNTRCNPASFLRAIEPYREDLVVAVECIFTWYWLADLCAREGIAFVLGHALYMKAIHGGKAKNDKIDAFKIAVLLRGGTISQAYVYPPEMRATRDLLRRRLYLVRKRGQLLVHIQNSHRVSYSSYMALRRVQSDRRRCTPGQKRKIAPLRDSVSRGEPSNNAMQLTGRPGTHLAGSAPPHISSKGGAQGARPSPPQLIAGVDMTSCVKSAPVSFFLHRPRLRGTRCLTCPPGCVRR